MTTVDMTRESDLDVVASVAMELAERIRDEDPHEVYAAAVTMCATYPAKAAQVLMTLAVWFDPSLTTTTEFWARVDAVTAPKQGTPHTYPAPPPIEYPPLQRVEDFEERYEELKTVMGLGDLEIAKRLGMTATAMERHMYRLGLAPDALLKELALEERRARRSAA